MSKYFIPVLTAGVLAAVIGILSINPPRTNRETRQAVSNLETSVSVESPSIQPEPIKQKENPRSYKTTDFSEDSEEVLLARMIFGEARGLSNIEKIAVGYTAINRAHDGKKWNGETVREAILKQKQYSCFNQNDKNRPKLMNPQVYEPKEFESCLDIADKILSGNAQDPTNGATHYFNPKVVLPVWADRMKEVGQIQTEKGISAHKFYIEK